MSNLLFSRRKLTELLQIRGSDMENEINGLEEDVLLNTATDDLCDYFQKKFVIEPLVLDESNIEQESTETKIDVTSDPRYYFRHWAQGSTWRLHIPFDGDSRLFDQRSSWDSSFVPKGKIDCEKRRIELHFEVLEIDYENFTEKLEAQLQNLRKWVGWNNDEVTSFNSDIRERARNLITNRKNSVLKIKRLAASIPFPLVRRPDAPSTYMVPLRKRRVAQCSQACKTGHLNPNHNSPRTNMKRFCASFRP